MARAISYSVGLGGSNHRSDVLTVQQLLNANMYRLNPLKSLAEDGKIGANTNGAIDYFQRRVVGMQPADGRVDPGGFTLSMLNDGAQNRTQEPAGGFGAMGGPGAGISFGSAYSSGGAGGGSFGAGDFFGNGPGFYSSGSPAGGGVCTPADPTGSGAPQASIVFNSYFSHPDADKVALTYAMQGSGVPAVTLNRTAANLLKSILASCGQFGATLNSTLRTYHDQARITITQTYPRNPAAVTDWYGATVRQKVEEYGDDIQGLADWWKTYDEQRGRVSSKHLSNQAMDVVPSGDRQKFADKVKGLVPIKGSGVRKIIPKGVAHEPVDHVEFTFKVTDQQS